MHVSVHGCVHTHTQVSAVLWAPCYTSRPSAHLAKRQGLCSHPAHLWATSDFVPRSEVLGTPLGGTGYVATKPTCGPLLILTPTLKRWAPKTVGVI